MNCPKCSAELEIFPRNGKEIYVCPLCLSALMPDESCVKILKHFCHQEIMAELISNLLDDSLFDNTKKMLAIEENLSCPKCKSYMQKYDFDKKTRFYVNKCITCGAIWLNQMQIPLISVSFIEGNPDDLNFKKSINSLYEGLARRKAKKIRPLDEIIAPFGVITGLAPAIPIGDNVLTKTKPIATNTIIIICILVFVAEFLMKISSLFSGLYSDKILEQFALYANKAANPQGWYRLITYAFLHGGFLHIIGNMVFLRTFGRSVEDELGWKKYLFLFVLGAVISGIFVIATITEKNIPCVGTSGAISAIIGAYLILFPKAKIRFNIYRPLSPYLPVPIQKLATAYVLSLYYILFWIIMNVVFGMLQAASKTIGIAYWGHIGGFIAGVIFIEVYKNLRQK